MTIDMDFLKSRPLSYSSMKAFLKSPAHYIQYISEKLPPTDALIFGSLSDCLLFTPQDFEKYFVITPEINKRTNEGKAAYATFLETANGKDVIDSEMHHKAKELVAALKANESAKAYIDRFEQVQLKIDFEIEELPFVAKVDAVGDTFIADLKTSVTAEPGAFIRSALNYDYTLQAAVYLKAVRKIKSFPDYYFITVEKEKPYACSVIKAMDDFIEYGNQQLEKAIQNFKFCMENNLWDKSYDFWTASGIYFAELPVWAKNKIEQ